MSGDEKMKDLHCGSCAGELTNRIATLSSVTEGKECTYVLYVHALV